MSHCCFFRPGRSFYPALQQTDGARGGLSFADNWLVLLIRLHAGTGGVQPDVFTGARAADVLILASFAVLLVGPVLAFRKGRRVWAAVALAQPILGIAILLITRQAGRSAVMGALLVISAAMLGNTGFGRAVAYAGILASIFLLLADLSAGIIHSGLMALLATIGYLFFILWLFAVSTRMIQMRHAPI